MGNADLNKDGHTTLGELTEFLDKTYVPESLPPPLARAPLLLLLLGLCVLPRTNTCTRGEPLCAIWCVTP